MTKETITEQTIALITEYLRLEPGECKLESHISNDLGADSLALVELGFKFSESFGIGMFTPDDNNMIIGNLIDLIFNEIKATQD